MVVCDFISTSDEESRICLVVLNGLPFFTCVWIGFREKAEQVFPLRNSGVVYRQLQGQGQKDAGLLTSSEQEPQSKTTKSLNANCDLTWDGEAGRRGGAADGDLVGHEEELAGGAARHAATGAQHRRRRRLDAHLEQVLPRRREL